MGWEIWIGMLVPSCITDHLSTTSKHRKLYTSWWPIWSILTKHRLRQILLKYNVHKISTKWMSTRRRTVHARFLLQKGAAGMQGTKYHIHGKLKICFFWLLLSLLSFLLTLLCSHCHCRCPCCFWCYFSCSYCLKQGAVWWCVVVTVAVSQKGWIWKFEKYMVSSC